jgi:hypothetical protein
MYQLGINEEEYFRLLLSTFQQLGFSFLHDVSKVHWIHIGPGFLI